MSKVEVGGRAGAILRADKETVSLIGYGVYQGEKVPPAGARGFGSVMHQAGIANPCILLDDGGEVFGYECWWGPEEKIREMIGDRQVLVVDMEKVRHE